MKKTGMIRILALLMVAVALCGTLCACGGKPSGVYENNTFGLVTTYTFRGNRYTWNMKGLSQADKGYEESGTFQIKGDQIAFTAESGSVKTLPFSLKGNVLTIDGLEFDKK